LANIVLKGKLQKYFGMNPFKFILPITILEKKTE